MEPVREQMVAPKKARLISRNFCLLFVTNFASCIIYYLTITIMASYALHSFMCSQSMAGLATSAFMVGAVVGRAVSGQASGPLCRPATIAGMVVMLVACASYFITPAAYGLLLVVRIAHGLAFGVVGTLLQVLSMEAMPPERLGEGVGYFTLSVTLGSAIGPFMGYFVVADVDYNLMFIMCTAAAAVGLVSLLVALSTGKKNGSQQEKRLRQENSGSPKKPLNLGTLVDLSTLKYSVIVLITGICYAPLNAFLYSYADELDMSICAPFSFLAYAAVLVVSRPVAGAVLDRKGYAPVLVVSMTAMMVGLIVASTAFNAVMFVSIGVFMALGFGTTLSTLQAAVTLMTNKPDATLAVSTLFLMADLGAAIGPFVMGFAATAWGYRGMYALCAVCAALCLVYFFLVVQHRDKRA